jgi:histidinol-phosphate/aromatic aminotransferase/cobyric acid decarboxylase-like protein
VRTFPTGSPLAAFMRITVRTADENARLVKALSEWRPRAG